MALITCTECYKEISDTAKSCPSCGYTIIQTKTKKERPTLKRLFIVLILIFIGAIGAFLIFKATSPTENAKNISNKFLNYLKQENYFEMGQISDISSGDLISDYVGINIIDYTIKSVVSFEEPYRIVLTPSSSSDVDVRYFNSMKQIYKDQNPDYDVIKNDNSRFVLESPTEIITKYTINYDVQYSTYTGETKRNNVVVVLQQEESKSSKYKVVEFLGLYNF